MVKGITTMRFQEAPMPNMQRSAVKRLRLLNCEFAMKNFSLMVGQEQAQGPLPQVIR